MPLFLSPVCNGQIFDANGDPLTGGKIETYLAGSSTPAATYVDDTGVTPQSNPIILNSLGYPTLGPIWLTGGVSYKFVIKDANDVTLRTIDDISGVNDASVSQSEWVTSGFTPTYISATSFSVPGDQTAILQINRRLRTTNTSGFIYSTITNSVFAAGITTVTVSNDSGSLDAGLTIVDYALLAASPLSVPNLPFSKITGTVPISQGGTGQTTGALAVAALFGTRVDVASAATVDLSSVVSSINITGTTTITAFTVAVGRLIFVRFAGVLTLTNNASIVTQTGANIVTQVGDTCILRATAANVVEVLCYTAVSKIALGIPVTLTTQTSVDFTGLPTSANRITLKGTGVSTNGTTGFGIQLGDSGGPEATGYAGASALQINAAGSQQVGNSTTFAGATASAAANVYHVKFTIERITGNTWHIEGSAGTSNVATLWSFSYTKTLSDVLDRVRFITGNGTDQFDAGTVNISWE